MENMNQFLSFKFRAKRDKTTTDDNGKEELLFRKGNIYIGETITFVDKSFDDSSDSLRMDIECENGRLINISKQSIIYQGILEFLGQTSRQTKYSFLCMAKKEIV